MLVKGAVNQCVIWGFELGCTVSLCFAVSAFYAECAEKQVQVNASIWTKSKFMGMSIGVVMVGKGRKCGRE